MRGVRVLIFTTNDELKGADLSRDVLTTDVELRLRKAGVPVLQGKERPTGYQKAVLVGKDTGFWHLVSEVCYCPN